MSNQDIKDTDHAEPVLIFDSATVEEAEVVHATLHAAGIRATLDHVDSSVIVGAVDPAIGSAWRRGVYVSPKDEAAARAVLSSIDINEESLTEEEELDSTTLEQAEKRANSE